MEDIETFVSRFEAVIDSTRRNQGHHFKERLDRLQLGLTGPQFFMLHLIGQQEPCKTTLLAEKMDVKPSAITVMLDRLVQAGFVSRHQDEHDRRVVLVRLTDKGREALGKIREVRRDILRHYVSALDPEELDVFLSLFEKLAKAGGNLKS